VRPVYQCGQSTSAASLPVRPVYQCGQSTSAAFSFFESLVPDRLARSSRAMTGRGKAILLPALTLTPTRPRRALTGEIDRGPFTRLTSIDAALICFQAEAR
jgi:hypothetical protein